MFEGWATDFLASYLGHFCELQKDQLRISLWRAWKTGFSLENVRLRADAFDYLQLPFKLLSGSVGRVQAQVPWHALRSAPVVIELSDVHLCLGLLDESDLAAGPAAERAWAAKQAELAVAELEAAAAASGGVPGVAGPGGSNPAASGDGGKAEGGKGMLWSFLQHLVTMLVNKLQLRVRNVHISLQDPVTGSVAGIKLAELSTCTLTEAEHISLLVEDPHTPFVPGSAATTRGTIHKQLALTGLSAYWVPGRKTGCTGAARPDEAQGGSGTDGGAGVGPSLGVTPAPEPEPVDLHPLLLPLSAKLQISARMPGSEHAAADWAGAGQLEGGSGGAEGMQVHVAAVVHGLELSLHHDQAADMLRLADGVAWLSARSACAVFRPAGWSPGGAGLVAAADSAGVSRRQLCRQLWRYAVIAVLQERRGQRDGVWWVDAAARSRLRRQYIAAYRDQLLAQKPQRAKQQQQLAAHAEQQQREGSGEADYLPVADSPISTSNGVERSLEALERQLTVADIVLCRQAARQLAAPPAAATPAKRRRWGGGDTAAAAVQQQAGAVPRPASPSLMHQPLTPPGAPQLTPFTEGQQAGLERSPSDAELDAGEAAADSQQQKGYISWGLSKVAGFLGYMPPAEGGATGLLEPSESDVRQLCEAVDFDPDREEAAGMKLEAQRASFQFSVDCLISRASLLLRHPPALTTAESPFAASPLAGAHLAEGFGGMAGFLAGEDALWAAAARSVPVLAQGQPIAALEVEHARLDLQVKPEAMTAVVLVMNVAARDLLTHGPGMAEELLGRLWDSPPPQPHEYHHHHQHPLPILRMKLHWPLAPPSEGSGGPPHSPPLSPPGHSPQEQPTLDVLVQPLQLHYRPLCLQQLSSVLPAVVAGTYHEHLMAAVNGLSSEARAAEKAAYLQYLGPAIDVLVKVLDVHIVFGKPGGGPTSPGAVLSTGSITFHTVRQHLQLTPEAALELLRRHCRGQRAGPGGEAAAATAVIAVEQQLVYQLFEFGVSGIQLAAVNMQLLGAGEAESDRGSERGGGRRSAVGEVPLPPSSADAGGAGRRTVLQPVKLGGTLKLHRITDDTALTAVQCSLQVDPITVGLTPILAMHLADLLTPPTEPQGSTSQATSEGGSMHGPPARQGPEVRPSGTSGGRSPAAAAGRPEGSAEGARSQGRPAEPAAAAAVSAGRRQVPPAVVLDVRLTSFDASYYVQGGRKGRVEAHAHVSLLRASAAVQVYPAGVEAQVMLSGLSFRDLSPEIFALLPVKGPIPHIAKAVSLESVALSFDGTAHGGRGSITQVQLQDLVLHGFAGDSGNFIARFNERKPTLGTVVINDSPTSLHTSVTLSNLLVGHALLLRIVALVLPGEDDGDEDEEPHSGQQQQQAKPSAAPAAAAAAAPAAVAPAVVAAGQPHPPGSVGTATGLGLLTAAAGSSSGSAGAPAAEAVIAEDPSVELWQEVIAGAGAAGAEVVGSDWATPWDAAGGVAAAAAAAGSAAGEAGDGSEAGEALAELVHEGGAAIDMEVEADEAALPPSTEQQQQQQRQTSGVEEEGLLGTSSPTSAQQQAVGQDLPTPPSPTSPASSPPGAVPTPPPMQPEPQPAKPVITTVQLTSCRLVYKYRRLPAGGSWAVPKPEAPPASAASVAAREFLELQEDILHLDIPSLSLSLPLEPAAVPLGSDDGPGSGGAEELGGGELGARPEAGQDWQAGPAAGQQEEGRAGQEPLALDDSGVSLAAAGSSPPSRPRHSRLRHSMSGHSLYTSASSEDLQGSSSSPEPAPAGSGSGAAPPELPPQPLFSLSGLTLSMAAEYPGHSMLPLLALPSVQLLSWRSMGAGQCGNGDQLAARGLAGSLAATATMGSSPSRGGGGSASAFAAAGSSPNITSHAAGQPVVRYKLEVGSVDIGVHPSQVTMAGVLVQQCQTELLMLMRDPFDVSATEGESVTISTSSYPPTLTQAATQERSQLTAAAVSQGVAGPQWQLDAGVDLIALSVLGIIPGKSCLKLEWHNLRCTASNCSASMAAVGAVPVLLAGEVSWKEVTLHTVVPRAVPPSVSFATPFAAAATGAFEDRASVQGPDLGSASDLLYHWSMGAFPPATQGARRSLSQGPGFADALPRGTEDSEVFQDASSRAFSGRRAGSSGMSRYYSAADSDFEDAASDWGEGASTPGGGSPRCPSPLPIKLSGGDQEVMTLARLLACPAGSSGGGSGPGAFFAQEPQPAGGKDPAGVAPGVVVRFEQHLPEPEAIRHISRRTSLQEQQRGYLEAEHEWGVSLASLALQVHMRGWEEAAKCLLSYAAPGKELGEIMQAALAPAPHDARRPAAPTPHPTPTAPLATAPSGSLGQQQQAGQAAAGRPASWGAVPQSPAQQHGAPFGVRVELRRVVVAAVADLPARPASLVGDDEADEEEGEDIIPAVSLTTAATISCCIDAVGGLHLGVQVPMALLGVGVVPRGAELAALTLPVEDSLLGLRQAEVSLVVQPPTAAGTLPATVAAEAAQHSPPHTSIAANLFQVSVWASQRNLCMLAAFGQYAQKLAGQLAPLGAHEAEVEKGQVVAAAGPGALLTMKLNLHKLVLLLSLAQYPQQAPMPRYHTPPVPLFELVAAAVSVDVHDVGVGWLEASVATRLQLDVFSSSKLGWEPVLEPWQCRVEVVAPTSASAHHQYLGLISQQGLELTVTDTAAEAAGLLAGALQCVPKVFQRPEELPATLHSAGGTASSLSAAWWLHNQTGAALQLWVVSPTEAQVQQLLAGPPMVTAVPGSKVALPVFAHGPTTQQQQRHAGEPDAVVGVAGCSEDHPAPASSLAQGEPLLQQQSHRTLLYFRMSEQSLPCGPVHLDRLEPSVHVVQPAELGDLPLRAKVVCELQEGRYGGSTVTLHSGVQVHNNTELPVDVGVQSPMGLVMEPQPLGTVQPGKSFWLPVLRAEGGLLCIRPAAGAAAAATQMVVTTAAAPPSADDALTASERCRSPMLSTVSYSGASTAESHMAGSSFFPPPHPGLLYAASGRLSPARASLDSAMLQQLDAALQQSDSGHGAAAAFASMHAHRHEWSTAVALQQLLRAAGGEGGGLERTVSDAFRPTRQLVCHPSTVSPEEQALIFVMGSSPCGGTGLVWDVTINPPLRLHNALPVPVEVTLRAWTKKHQLSLRPNQHVGIHQLEASHVENLVLKALGYHTTSPVAPHPISSQLIGQEMASMAAATPDGGALANPEIKAPETLVQLEEAGHSGSTVQVSLQHSLNIGTGSHTLRLGCTLWVYNLTGLPISLRQSVDDPLVLRDAELKMEEDVVPATWVPPLSLQQPQSPHPHAAQGGTGGGGGSSSSGGTPLQPRLSSPLRQLSGLRSVSREGAHSMRSVPNLLSPTGSIAPAAAPSGTPSAPGSTRAPSTIDMPGLGEILAEEEGHGPQRQQVHGMKRAVSRARGIADSMETAPQFETPSRWPSMHGGLLLHRGRLRLQVRATQCKAPEGRTYWSDSVELDAAVGGAAVVTAPSPLLPPAAQLPAPKAAYMMSVTSTQVPGSSGALALYLLPRYLLHNALDMPIQYKQQGTQFEKELQPGASRPLMTADGSRALRLCVRVQEAGWLWSGGFALDTPGDLFIKIRHRDRGVTMLVRVDVAASASGVLVVTLSHHPSGFAPYRIENCSLETLHAQQHRCKEQQDVLRPYCSLNYAWDEPALPHRLVLELPGNRLLGSFLLDKVGQDVILPVPTRKGEPERKVRVLVRAEGPTRVLTVLDINRHSLVEELQLQPESGAALGGAAAQAGSSGGSSSSAASGRWPYQQWRLGAGSSSGGGGERGGSVAAVEGRAAAASASAGGGLRSGRLVPSGLLWEVSAELASAGVSLVSPSQELGYLRLGQLRTSVAVSAARLVVELEFKTLQVDNPSRWVAHPVALVLPAPTSRLTSTMAAAKLDKSRRPALTLHLAVWQRRPAGVLCIEHADLQVAPVGIFIEQQHALQLAAFLNTLAASFLPPPQPSAAVSVGPVRTLSIGGLGAFHTAEAPSGRAGSSRAVSVNGDLPSPSPAYIPTPIVGREPGQGQLLLQLPPDLLALLCGQSQIGMPQGQKVYIDIMRVGPLDITVSFLPAPWDPQSGGPRAQEALQRLLSLADVEDAHLKLAGLTLRHPLMGTTALAQHLQRHYMKAALPELLKVVGAANVFGDPVRLVHHLGLGVWSFLASPAAGLVESARQRGPSQFVAGLVSGTRGLFANVVFGVSNAATKGSGAARKFIVVLGLDRYDRNWASSTFHRRIRFDEHLPHSPSAAPLSPRSRRAAGRGGGSESGMFGAVMRGIVGVISEPIRGVDEGGLAGFVQGLKRGILGFVVIPLASLLEMSARMADSIRRAVAGTSSLAWVRPPRYVSPGDPLLPYDWHLAMGRWLLLELDRAQQQHDGTPLQQEATMLCISAAARGHYLLATPTKVLYVHAREPMWVPLVKWSACLADLELVTCQAATLTMVALQPERTHFVRSMWDQLSDARARRGPWSILRVDCEGPEAAGRFAEWVRRLAAGQQRMMLLGQAQLLLPG